MKSTFKKLVTNEVKGAKDVKGKLGSMAFCPYCQKHVESLRECLRVNHGGPE